jgi:hypothetical protein
VLKRDYILCLQYECCGVEKYTDMHNAPTLPDACCPNIKNNVTCTEAPGGPEENHRSVAHILNVVHLALIEIRTHNISGDMH